MTYFKKLENGKPSGDLILEENIRALVYPKILPLLITPNVVEELGYCIYEFSAKPIPEFNQKVVDDVDEKTETGIWLKKWKLVPLSDTELQDQEKILVEKTINIIYNRVFDVLNTFARQKNFTGFPEAMLYLGSGDLEKQNQAKTIEQHKNVLFKMWEETSVKLRNGTLSPHTLNVDSLFPPLSWDVVPTYITMRQARLILLQEGLLNQVETAINNIQDETQKAAAKIEWEYAQTVHIDSPLVTQIANSFGLTRQQIETMFKNGSKL